MQLPRFLNGGIKLRPVDAYHQGSNQCPADGVQPPRLLTWAGLFPQVRLSLDMCAQVSVAQSRRTLQS